MTGTSIDPPEGIPDDVVRALEASSDHQLRKVIHYAQQLVREHASRTAEIEPREGEVIVRVDDKGAYTIVVVERPEESGEARGPFVYRVEWEPAFGEGEGHYRWHYLGRAEDRRGSG